MPRLMELLPTRFAQDCATNAFVDGCKEALKELSTAESAQAAASILAGAAGGPLAFLAIYTSGAILQWKRDKSFRQQAQARFRELHEAIRVVGDDVRDQKELAGLLEELLRRDRDLRKRLEDAEEGHTGPNGAAQRVIEEITREIEVSFDGVRIYLSNIADWMGTLQATTERIDETTQRTEGKVDNLTRMVEALDQRLKNQGEHATLSDADRALLDEARAYGDAKTRARAAIIARDFGEADELLAKIEDKAISEAFDVLTLKGDRQYYAGQFDAAIEPYERALALRPNDIRARHNLALAHIRARLGDIAEHLRRAIEILKGSLPLVPEGTIDWARTQNNLGVAYADLPTGDRTENLRRAIAAYESALKVYTREAFPADWAGTQRNLGVAYLQLPTGDRAENLRRAIAAYESALEVYTRDAFPARWADTQDNLARALAVLAGEPGQDTCALLA